MQAKPLLSALRIEGQQTYQAKPLLSVLPTAEKGRDVKSIYQTGETCITCSGDASVKFGTENYVEVETKRTCSGEASVKFK